MSTSADTQGVGETLPSELSDESTPAEDVSQDHVFELLSNERRRYTLHHLQQRETTVELGELAEQVAAWENETHVRDVSSMERKSVYTSLQQFHLPKLEDQGFVIFDDRAGLVELGPAAEEVDIYMEVVPSTDVPWSQYYLGLAAVSTGVIATGAITTSPFGLISQLGAGICVVTALAISALVHSYYRKTEMRLGAGEKPPALER